MIEFGAILSLKDRMAATLKKNLDLQRQFSQQVERVNSGVKKLGNQKANPTIMAQDDASEVIDTIRDGLKSVSMIMADPEITIEDAASAVAEQLRSTLESLDAMGVSPKVEVKDEATAQADEIADKIREIGKYVASPVIKLKDLISSEAGKISRKLKEIATTYTPIVKIRDAASQGLSKIKNTLGSIGKMVAKPFITVKDKASPIVEKLKSSLKLVGKTTAKAALAVKDGATKILEKVKSGLKTIGSTTAKAAVAIKDGASAGLDKIKSLLSTLAKGVTIAVGMVGTGTVASLLQGAKLEQSMGGVETLFKDDAGAVMANANKAFSTAGLSANDYMETVTGFSASLLQSLGGDTAKAAKIADMAVIDMADNANKFGTDMASIQNAYQGFAKQNYTMLDNLKLGYGGTKEEMERLLVDAAKLSGQSYSIDSLSDVYSAINVVQTELGVAGTTAKEASETFSGSFAAMKASAQNLLGNLAIGGDVSGSMAQLIDSASTFVAGNLIPMVVNIFTGLPDAIRVGMSNAAPRIMSALESALPPSAFNFLTGLFDTAKTVVSAFTPVVQQLGSMFSEVGPVIADTLGGAFGDGSGFIQGFANMISAAIPTIGTILKGVGNVIATIAPVFSSLGNMFQEIFPSILAVVDAVFPAIQSYMESWGGVIQTLMPTITQIIQTFAGVVQQVFPIVSQIITMVVNAVMPVIQAFAGIIQQALPLIQNIITVVAGAIQSVMPTISQIFTEVGSKVAEVINTVMVPVINVLSQIFQTVSPIIQSAVEIVAQVFSAAWDVISPILDLAMSIFNALWSVVEAVFPAIQNTIETVWGVLEPIFGALADALSWVGDALSTVGGWIGDGIDTIGGWLGFAYGKDRVPYNNYPAILHEGEKVLTRNQADQYDRVMSTRGIELSPTLREVSRDTSSSKTEAPVVVTPVTEEQPVNAPSVTININDPVIRERADVDYLVQEMVTKFRKIVPNMA